MGASMRTRFAIWREQMSDIAAADEYFICGPGGMVDEVRDALKL